MKLCICLLFLSTLCLFAAGCSNEAAPSSATTQTAVPAKAGGGKANGEQNQAISTRMGSRYRGAPARTGTAGTTP